MMSSFQMIRKATSRFGTIASRSLTSFSQADLPKIDFKPEKYDGPSAEQLKEWRQAHVHPSVYALYKEPLPIVQGHMQYVYDDKGQRYIDFLGGICTISVGHCHPKLVAALQKQSSRLWHCTTIYNHPPLSEYANKLTSKFPEPLKYVYFVNSGSEANDLALMMARIHTGCQDVVSLRYAYHGLSPYTQALSALSTWRHNVPLSPGHHHAVTPDPYKGPWGGDKCRNSILQPDRKCDCSPGQCKACDNYVNEVEDLMKATCVHNKVGAFIAESIMGSAGTVQFPKDYLTRVYPLIKARGGVCIADEVQTGFGRTGQAYWGWQTHRDIQPDIVTMAKGVGNGFPLAAVVTTKEIAQSLSKAMHFNTFGGNPMACAVGSAVIDIIEEDKLQQNCREVGEYALKKLKEIQGRHPVMGDVRGIGLMFAVELVSDPVKKTPLPLDTMNELLDLMREKYVLFGRTGLTNNVFRCVPPMCTTKADVDYVVAAFDKSLQQIGM